MITEPDPEPASCSPDAQIRYMPKARPPKPLLEWEWQARQLLFRGAPRGGWETGILRAHPQVPV